MSEPGKHWRRRLERVADWDFYFQVAFIIVMLFVGAILVHLEGK